MSWTQGVQLADDLPEWFQKLANKLKKDPEHVFQCIVWDETDRDILSLDYYTKDGEYVDSVTLNFAKLEKQLREADKERGTNSG